jgi:hypothetical protein
MKRIFNIDGSADNPASLLAPLDAVGDPLECALFDPAQYFQMPGAGLVPRIAFHLRQNQRARQETFLINAHSDQSNLIEVRRQIAKIAPISWSFLPHRLAVLALSPAGVAGRGKVRQAGCDAIKIAIGPHGSATPSLPARAEVQCGFGREPIPSGET